jgi:anthranilate phosphoribosyltransferase
MPTDTATILESLAKGRNLSQHQAASAFSQLMTGELSEGQAGALLMGLRAKGETPTELAAAVSECLGQARLVPGLSGPRIDTCGTGGAGRSSFNCSTTVALVLAAMGHTVVKHGNRSVSSKSGSADVLEALGFSLSVEPDAVADQLAESNFVFLFAPSFHPAFKHVMPLRKSLGIRTLFNLMGPLLNPARPTHQVLGVADASLMDLVAKALAMSGVEKAAVVHGYGQEGGYDELTPFGENRIVYVRGGEVEEDVLHPKLLGLDDDREERVAVDGPEASLAAVKELLAGRGDEVMAKMTALNLAMALHLLEDLDLNAAADKAREALASGAAAQKLGLK